VSLTTGRGPLGDRPAGRFSEPLPRGVVYVEPFQRRVRAVLAGRTVVDSERVVLVPRPGRPPTYAFPVADVHGVAADAEPAAPGHVAVASDAVDAWFEEAEEVHGHPRNPFHRIDCLRSTRHLRVEVAGEVLVDTRDTVALYETSLAPKLYADRAAVRTDLLVPSPTTSYCPYKGTASWWSARVGDVVVEDVAWSYEDPLPESLPIAGLLSFDGQRAAVTTDVPPPAF